MTRKSFDHMAKVIARFTGHPTTFLIAVLTVVTWGIIGPIFHFSDTWQLVINTGTTIITFLMVFLIQNTQSRDSEAMQIKLDELIRATRGAHNALLNLEELGEKELILIRARYEKLAEKAKEELKKGKIDTNAEEIS